MLSGPFVNSIYVVIIVNTRNHPLSKMDGVMGYTCIHVSMCVCVYIYAYGSRGQWSKRSKSLPFMEGVNR